MKKLYIISFSLFVLIATLLLYFAIDLQRTSPSGWFPHLFGNGAIIPPIFGSTTNNCVNPRAVHVNQLYGSDRNEGSSGAPKRTIVAALHVLTNNGTMFLHAGIYNERGLLRNGLTNYTLSLDADAHMEFYQASTNDSGAGLLDERGITTPTHLHFFAPFSHFYFRGWTNTSVISVDILGDPNNLFSDGALTLLNTNTISAFFVTNVNTLIDGIIDEIGFGTLNYHRTGLEPSCVALVNGTLNLRINHVTNLYHGLTYIDRDTNFTYTGVKCDGFTWLLGNANISSRRIDADKWSLRWAEGGSYNTTSIDNSAHTNDFTLHCDFPVGGLYGFAQSGTYRWWVDGIEISLQPDATSYEEFICAATGGGRGYLHFDKYNCNATNNSSAGSDGRPAIFYTEPFNGMSNAYVWADGEKATTVGRWAELNRSGTNIFNIHHWEIAADATGGWLVKSNAGIVVLPSIAVGGSSNLIDWRGESGTFQGLILTGTNAAYCPINVIGAGLKLMSCAIISATNECIKSTAAKTVFSVVGNSINKTNSANITISGPAMTVDANLKF